MNKQKATPCKSCGAKVVWVMTEAGKKMPIDPDPSEFGNIYFQKDGTVLVLTKYSAEGQRRLGKDLFLSHFVTCPNASSHRKAKSPKAPGQTQSMSCTNQASPGQPV